MNIKTLMAFITLSLLFNVAVCKADTTYSVEYSPKSPIKTVPLKNVSIKLEIFAYQNPHGYVTVKTDGNQTFSLKNKHDLSVVSIEGEEKYNASCAGFTIPNHLKVIITCSPR